MSSNNRHWTNIPQLNKDFIDLCLCLTQIATCGYQGTSLKPQSWQSIRETLQGTYPAVFNQVGDKQKFIKNRWNQLKKKYAAFRLCMKYTGNVYNETTGLFTFTEDQWKTLYKQNPDTLQFKTKPLEYKDEIYNMFEGVLVSFEDVQSHSMMNKNYEEVTDEAEGFVQDPYFEGVGIESTQVPSTPTTPLNSSNPAVIPSSSGTSSSTKRKRVLPTVTNDPAIGELVSMMHGYFGQRIAERSVTAGSSAEHTDGEDESFAQCMTIITSMKAEVPLEKATLNGAIIQLAETKEFRK